MSTERLYGIVLTALPILLSLSVHEFAHARTALAFGDPTAKARGRCTLNPLAHLNFVGTLMIFFVGFGWAKPVPVNPNYLHPRRMGEIAVGLAGPASNFALAVLCSIALLVMTRVGVTVNINGRFQPTDVAVLMLTYGVFINLALCLFNLIPVFPLDGHHIVREILPRPMGMAYMRWQVQYGMWTLLALMIAPRLLGSRFPFNPIGMYIGRTSGLLVTVLMTSETLAMAIHSLQKFAGYTPFG